MRYKAGWSTFEGHKTIINYKQKYIYFFPVSINDITKCIILTVIITVMPPKWPNTGEATMSECKRTSSLKDRGKRFDISEVKIKKYSRFILDNSVQLIALCDALYN